jgi:hypothetical protein
LHRATEERKTPGGWERLNEPATKERAWEAAWGLSSEREFHGAVDEQVEYVVAVADSHCLGRGVCRDVGFE